jgi:hypothetical protein
MYNAYSLVTIYWLSEFSNFFYHLGKLCKRQKKSWQFKFLSTIILSFEPLVATIGELLVEGGCDTDFFSTLLIIGIMGSDLQNISNR